MMHAPKEFVSYLRPEPDQPGFLSVPPLSWVIERIWIRSTR